MWDSGWEGVKRERKDGGVCFLLAAGKVSQACVLRSASKGGTINIKRPPVLTQKIKALRIGEGELVGLV